MMVESLRQCGIRTWSTTCVGDEMKIVGKFLHVHIGFLTLLFESV